MVKKKNKEVDAVADFLKDLLIVELCNAGVPKQEIRKIVGCDMNRVSRITKFLGKGK
jgi:hypothetical protein